MLVLPPVPLPVNMEALAGTVSPLSLVVVVSLLREELGHDVRLVLGVGAFGL